MKSKAISQERFEAIAADLREAYAMGSEGGCEKIVTSSQNSCKVKNIRELVCDDNFVGCDD